jgi:hypothetical protein
VELRSGLFEMDGTELSHPGRRPGGAEDDTISRIPSALASESGHAEPLAEYGSRHSEVKRRPGKLLAKGPFKVCARVGRHLRYSCCTVL